MTRSAAAAGWRLLVAALLLAVAFLAAGPAPEASAHATLLFTSPAVDGAVPTSPSELQLVFDQPVVPSASALSLEGDAGEAFPLGEVMLGDQDQIITAPVPDRLPVGQYVVQWQVGAQDGEAMSGEYRFAVGSTTGLSPGGTQVRTDGLTATTLMRWALFGGLALALGGLVGSRLVSRAEDGVRGASRRPRPWTRVGAIIGAAASAGLALLIVGGGSVSGGLAQFSVAELMASPPGRLVGLELLIFTLVAILVGGGVRELLGGSLLLVIPVAEGLRAHPQGAMSGLGAVLTSVHLVAAAVWVGALIHVIRVGLACRREGIPVGGLVSSYARLALWLFVAVAATGSVAALVLVPTGELTTTLTGTTYGRWLVVKVALVGLVAGSALLARRLLRTQPGQAQPGQAATWEVSGLVAVLGISGLLTALPLPVRGDAPLPFPPPAVGPVVSVGSRAGFIGIGVTASGGQLLVRLNTPDDSPEIDAGRDPSLELVANLTADDDGEARRLDLRRCGTGCFVAPTEWSEGLSTVTLRASSDSWSGGTAAVTVAWPPDPAARRLEAVVATMRTIPELVLHEQATSDTTQAPGLPQRLRLSGSDFLAAGPYKQGMATTATVLAESEGETTLALGYPAEATYILLTVGADQRIIRESVASSKHLLSRTFVYPDQAELDARHRAD